MSFDISSVFDLVADVGELVLDAVDVSSVTDAVIGSDFYGAEFLGSVDGSFIVTFEDGATLAVFADSSLTGIDLQGQVGTFAGDGLFVDLTDPGSIISDSSQFIPFDAADFVGPIQPSLIDRFISDVTTGISSFTDSLVGYFTPANISKTVTDFAVQQAKQLVAQAVAQVVPPELQPYLNQAINTAVQSASATAVPVGTAFDDDGNLNIGWTLQENGDPLFVGGGFIDATGEFLDKAAAVNDPNIAALIDAGVRGATNFVKENFPAAVNDTNIAALVAGGEPARALLRSLASTGTVTDPGLANPPLDSAALAILATLAPGESALINGQWITVGSAEASALAAAAAARAQGLIIQAQNQQTARIQSNNNAATGDWRVRLQLADSSNYLYNAPDCGPILWPLRDTNGVIFPYTPTIDMVYKANYATYDLTHSNYRGYFYQSSNIDGVNIKGTFTAQDSAEANYLLAVIHFFRSVTKMFYGQDAQRGTPPPLVFLSGLGDFQFNRHPCVVSQFSYSLPADVNYIRAQSTVVNGGNQLAARIRQTTSVNPIASTIQRLTSLGQNIFPGAVTAPFAPQGSLPVGNPTYVPTKMDISLVLFPIQSRSQVSQQFSLRGFANGNLLKGGFW